MKKRVIVQKEGTETTTETNDLSDLISEVSNSELLTDSEYEQISSNSENIRICRSLASYKRPHGGTRQENLTKDEMLKMLDGYIPLRTMEDKRILTRLRCFKSFIRYINLDTNLFRIGGILTKVVYPDYIMLMNPRGNIVWSVQLRNTVIYIKAPGVSQKEKESMIKEKLYSMYKKGQLQRV